MIERLKNILVSPKTEWLTIEKENAPHLKVLTTYVAPLALIPAIAAFIGYGLIGVSVGFGFASVKYASVELGIRMAIIQYVSMILGVYISAFVINILAENFGAKKNLNQAFSLVAYAYTPMFVAGIFYILPSLSWLAMIAGIYGLYLLYVGLQPMMKAPADKQSTYFVVSLIVMIVVGIVLSLILTAILYPKMGFGLGDFNFSL